MPIPKTTNTPDVLDRYAANHAKASPHKTPKKHTPPSVRDQLHALMIATAGNPYGWFYNEVRPLAIPPKLSHGVHADCSFGVKILCHWAGLKDDPTGEKWTGYGNTVSIYNHLSHIPLSEAKVGDILLFGPGGAWHATMILKPDPVNPLLWSHGHQGAPNLYHLKDDKRTPITVCRIPAP